jgi:hypothetical protein
MIKTLRLADIELERDESEASFADDMDISDWAKDFIYTAKSNKIMGGTGNNNFSPKNQATVEQALYVTHNLMKEYGSLTWYEAYDKERVYLRFNENLYRIPLEEDVLVHTKDNVIDLQLLSLDDLEKIINAVNLKILDLSFIEDSNPNIEGVLEIHDYKKMTQSVQNIFLGVDKIGETTEFTFGNEAYVAKVTNRQDRSKKTYDNFDSIKYYDLTGLRQEVKVINLAEILEAMEIPFTLEYNETWDIYEIEVKTE